MRKPRSGQAPWEFPEFLPPFLGGAIAFAGDGMLWVKRTTVADAPPTFDVIDGAGKVVEQILLNKGSQLVGFGNGTVYVVRIDADDLQYLQRHRVSGRPRP